VIGDILQPTHLLFILVVALLVLGQKRLPEVGRSLGRGLRDFRSALSGEDHHDEMVPQTITTTEQPVAQPSVVSEEPFAPAGVAASEPVARPSEAAVEPVARPSQAAAEPVAHTNGVTEAPHEPVAHANGTTEAIAEPAPEPVERLG
jgi:sec-independent protein translocase protein TatA